MPTLARGASLILFASVLTLNLSGCRDGGDSKTPLSAVVPNGSASVPSFARNAAPAEAPAEEHAEAAGESDEAEGEAVAEGGAGGATNDGAEAAAEPADDGPLPEVDVRNVGMHIGGESNTAESKKPIRAAVSEHYDAMKRCYAKATETPKGATFGVDMRIKGEGGPAKITNPRSGLKGGGVKECLVTVFEGIEFPKQPKGVARMVSFSVEFRKKK